MHTKQTNFVQRLVSAVLFTPVIVFALFWSYWTYFLLFFYVLMLSMLEFYKLLKRANFYPMREYGICIGLLFYTITFTYYLQEHFSPVVPYLCFPLVLLAYILALYRRSHSNPFVDIAVTFLGIVYIAVPFGMLHCLAFFKGPYSYELILGLLLIVWGQDVGAYLVGSTIGRTKLFKRISPQKTWEGLFGGACTALIASYVVASFFTILPTWQWVGIAALTMLTGTYGDLVASFLKRSVDAKNSSERIPGHGGFLDRVDSLLFTIPMVVAFLEIISLSRSNH